jgi:hypothetical protein
MTSLLGTVLAEAHVENATPAPWVLGAAALGTLLLALLIVTRFNKDR